MSSELNETSQMSATHTYTHVEKRDVEYRLMTNNNRPMAWVVVERGRSLVPSH
jgi:hypothetical protein